MRRVLLSIGIGFVLVIGYVVLAFILYTRGFVSLSNSVVPVPLMLPLLLSRLVFDLATIQNFQQSHQVIAGIYFLFINAIVYSVPVYLILGLIKRIRRKPEPVATDPPPPPEFD
jgi:hypothetical protein